MSRTSMLPMVRRWLIEDVSVVRIVTAPNGRGGFTTTRQVVWAGKGSVSFPSMSREGETAVIESARTVAYFSFDPEDVPPLKMSDVIVWDGADWQIQGYVHRASERVTTRVLAWRTKT